MRGNRKIAVAVLTVHEAHWRVKSSTVARLYLEKYLDTAMSQQIMNNEEETEDASPPEDQSSSPKE